RAPATWRPCTSITRRSTRATCPRRVRLTPPGRVLTSLYRCGLDHPRVGTHMAAAVAAGYLLGSIPFALLIARRWSGVDLRRVGSGNLGAANAARAAGLAAGLLVALLDIGKGAMSVLIASMITSDA